MKLEEVKDEDLPAEMKGKTLEEKKVILAAKQVERVRIQAEVQVLQTKREAFLANAARNQANEQGVTLDDALKQAIRSQATKKGMQFVPPAPVAPPVVPPVATPARVQSEQ